MMNQSTSELELKYVEYVEAAANAAEDLRFLLSHNELRVSIDFSETSLETLERIYWDFNNGKNKWLESFGTIDDFANLIARYMGECICHHTSANWTQTKEKNPMFGQPCLDGFGNAAWERIYPVDLANNLRKLPETKPFFPGVRSKTVLAEQLRQAIKIQSRR
jgi:hypothetical protein